MHERALWRAVVLQARLDIEGADYGTTTYDAATSFFTSPGEWAESRQSIAACLELHADDLRQLGRSAIAARHLSDGGPASAVTKPAESVSAPVDTPLLKLRQRTPLPPRQKRDKNWWIERFMRTRPAQ
jgi:hypothetical protein